MTSAEKRKHESANPRELALLHEIAVRANRAVTIRDVLAFALERLGRAQGWSVAHAYLLQQRPDPVLRPAVSLWRCSDPARFRDFKELTRRSSFEPGEGLVGEIAMHAAPRWITNAAREDPPVRFTDRDLEVRSGLLTPIVTTIDSPADAVLEFYSAERRRRSPARIRVAASVCSLLARVFERERAERELAERREAEQQRIGRELHDTVSQDLTGIAMMAERLSERMEDAQSELDPRMKELISHISEVRGKVHALSRGLLPVEVENRDLRPALEHLATSTQKLHNISCRVRCEGDSDVGDPSVAHQLARIAMEAVQNSVKHARARSVEIGVSRRNDRLTLSITDDGSGFSTRRQKPGIGLRLMQHRAATIGAEFSIISRPGRGTRVRCEYSKPRRK